MTVPFGLPPDSATLPIPGEIITSEATGDCYTVGEKIGEGHFGFVYGCVDMWKNNLAAKVLKPRVLRKSQSRRAG